MTQMETSAKIKELIKEDLNKLTQFEEFEKAFKYVNIPETLHSYLVLHNARNIIVSGAFGELIVEHLHNNYVENVIMLPGGLKEGVPTNLGFAENIISEKEYFYVDDSIYTGKTRDLVYEAISRAGGKVVGTIVVFDGLLMHDTTVHSMYRYYEYEE